jgi:hypothetical protein
MQGQEAGQDRTLQWQRARDAASGVGWCLPPCIASAVAAAWPPNRTQTPTWQALVIAAEVGCRHLGIGVLGHTICRSALVILPGTEHHLQHTVVVCIHTCDDVSRVLRAESGAACVACGRGQATSCKLGVWRQVCCEGTPTANGCCKAAHLGCQERLHNVVGLEQPEALLALAQLGCT